MSEYINKSMKRICPRCHYSTNVKTVFRKHLQRKHPCKPLFSDISIDKIYNDFNMEKRKKKGKPQCQHCSRVLSTNGHLKRHLKTCKVLKQKEDDFQKKCTKQDRSSDFMKEVLAKMKAMEEEIKTLKLKAEEKNTSKIIHINGDNNTVILNSYGHENKDYLTDNIAMKFISKAKSSITKMFEFIYMNKDHPENQIMFQPNIRDKHIKLHENNAYHYKVLTEFLPELTDYLHFTLTNEYYKRLKANMPPHVKAKYKTFCKTWADKFSQERIDTYKSIVYALMNGIDGYRGPPKLST